MRWRIPVHGGLRPPITLLVRGATTEGAAEVWAFGLSALGPGLFRIRIEHAGQVEDLIEHVRTAYRRP